AAPGGGQPPLRRLVLEALSRPGPRLPRPHPRGQPRADRGGQALRPRAQREVHLLRRVVGAAGHLPRALRAPPRVPPAPEALGPELEGGQRARPPGRGAGAPAHHGGAGEEDGDDGGGGREAAQGLGRRPVVVHRGGRGRQPRAGRHPGAGDHPVRGAPAHALFLRGTDPQPGGGAGREGARRAAHALRPGRRRTQDPAGDRGGAGAQRRAHPPDREQGQGEAAAQPARAGPARGAELRRAWLLLLPWALLAPSEAQITITTPADPNSRDKPLQRTYGRPEPVDLDQIAYNGASYQKRNVLTRG